MFIVVTGASKGIGFEMVKQLAADSDNTVLAVARSGEQLRRLHKKFPENVIPVIGDLTRKATLDRIVSTIRGNGKKVDVLINNAGALINKPFQKISASELQSVYNVNVFAPFQLIQALVPFMGKRTGSHIVNISSIGGVQGSSKFPGLSAYSSSKAALANLSELLAEELKPLNISCNCLALGAVQTEMLAKAFPGYKAPLEPGQMASFIVQFALTGHAFFNGKILPVSSTTP